MKYSWLSHIIYIVSTDQPLYGWQINIKDQKKREEKNVYTRLYTSSTLLLAHITGNESGWFGQWGGKAGRPGGRRRCRWEQTWRRGHNWEKAGSLDTMQSAGGLCRHPPHPTPAATGRTSPLHTAGTDLQRWQWGTEAHSHTVCKHQQTKHKLLEWTFNQWNNPDTQTK